jgi:hypothetical protein
MLQTARLCYTEKVVFQLLNYKVQLIRLWRGIPAILGGENKGFQMFMAAVLMIVLPSLWDKIAR